MTQAFYLDAHKTVKMCLNMSRDNDPNHSIDHTTQLGSIITRNKISTLDNLMANSKDEFKLQHY